MTDHKIWTVEQEKRLSWKGKSIGKLAEYTRRSAEEVYRHLDMMAAAYFKATDIDPEDVKLVQEFKDGGARVEFYFVRMAKQMYELRDEGWEEKCPHCGKTESVVVICELDAVWLKEKEVTVSVELECRACHSLIVNGMADVDFKRIMADQTGYTT